MGEVPKEAINFLKENDISGSFKNKEKGIKTNINTILNDMSRLSITP